MNPLHERLASLLEVLLPPRPEKGLSGAGGLGLAPEVAGRAGDPARGLDALDELARAAGAADFDGLDPDARVAAVRRLEAAEPMWLALLVHHLYAVYYATPAVLEALGLEPRPPFPAGYELAPGDLGGLERVRARGRLFREA